MKEIKLVKIVQFRKVEMADETCPHCKGTGKRTTLFLKRRCTCIVTALVGETSYVPIPTSTSIKGATKT